MMKLSLMQSVVDTLNDAYESPISDTILAAWGHDEERAHYFRASANFIFAFEREGQPHVLRFTYASERSVETIKGELAYLSHLDACGVPVALPVPSLSGRSVESVSTPLGVFHAVVFERLPGEQFEFGDLSLAQFTRWGRALGELHRAAEGYGGAGRPTVHDHLQVVAQQLPAHEDVARRLLERVQRQIATMSANAQTFGLIHFDFELDNLLWHGQRVNIIDFDDCAGYWFVADIAFALRDLFHEQPQQIDVTDERFQAFVTGYRMVRTMTDEELDQLPLFLQIHNLVTFTKLLRAIGSDGVVEAPEWVVGLRNRLLRKAQTYRDNFANAVA